MTAPPARPPELPGYDFVGPVEHGEGGYATVFVYRQRQPRRDVAVKVLRDHGVGQAQFQAMLDEASAMAALEEEQHIVPVYGAMMSTDEHPRPCIVMMYCGGKDLMTLVSDKDAPGGQPRLLSMRRVIRLGIQIAGVVHAAHERGIVHRDIKPANILTDNKGNPRLTDFGIAGRLGVADDEDRLVGHSLPWCPPEILLHQPASVASDVFSLGATLWHLLSGRSPFDVPGHNTTSEVEARVKAARAPSTGRAGSPPELEQLLARMMAKEPYQRPASALEVVEELTRIEQRLGAPRRGEPWHTNELRPGATPVHGALLRTSDRRAPRVAASPSVPVLPMPRLGPPPAPGPGLGVPGALPGETVVKPASRVEPATVEPEPKPEPTGGRRWVSLMVGATVVVLAIGGLVVTRPWQRDAPAQSSTEDIGETVPDPGLPPGRPTVVATRVDAATLRFEWTYSAPLDSDTYQWRITGTEEVQTATEPNVEVPSPAGTQVCVEVKVVRFDGSYASLAWSEPGCGS